MHFLFMFVLQIGYLFFALMSHGINLSFDYLYLPLLLIVLLTKSINFLLLLVQFNPVPALEVFLQFHPHDVTING